MSERLTEPQRRHLRELLGDGTQTLYWTVTYGGPEHRCALALQKKGLIQAERVASFQHPSYSLTDEGLVAARGAS